MLLPSRAQINVRPYQSLTRVFLLSKFLLLILACLSPGPGYDTSTQLLFRLTTANTGGEALSLLGRAVQHISSKLVRWDAVYFVSNAKDGYVYEQQWAFSWGLASVIGRLARLVHHDGILSEALAGILVAHVAHFLSVLVLYELAVLLTGPRRTKDVAFVTATLHIFSPAGLFLSAPYAESIFSLLHFMALLAYCKSNAFLNSRRIRILQDDLYLIISGLFFAGAAMMRGNGLLSGIIYLYDLVTMLPLLLPVPIPRHLGNVRHLAALILSGLLLALGFAFPQFLAYREYCGGEAGPSRSWCTATPPSIYTFVQSHYWNVGFLRYWTLSNIPLFFLAAPMLTVMFWSSFEAFSTSGLNSITDWHARTVIRRLAASQWVLALTAATTFHVQIITRVSSGYPLVYLWLASRFLNEGEEKTRQGGVVTASAVLRWILMYAMIQGGLFASFMPPA